MRVLLSCSEGRGAGVVAVAVWLMLGHAAPASSQRASTSPAQPADQGSLPVRTFVLEHRPVDEAYALVVPYLSERAEAVVSHRSRRLRIHDEAAILEQVAIVLEAFDVPARTVRISVLLVKGIRKTEVGGPRVDPIAGDSGVPPNLRDFVHPSDFHRIGEVTIEVREGQCRKHLLGDPPEFRVSIEVGAVREGVVELERFSLDHRRRGDEDSIYRPVLQFADDLAIGQRRILVATPRPNDPRALFLILTTTLDES